MLLLPHVKGILAFSVMPENFNVADQIPFKNISPGPAQAK
jgi:hypothetical protein